MGIVYTYFSHFTLQQIQQLELLESIYTKWNTQINVISRKDMDGLYLKHVLHSLSIAAVFEFTPDTNIIDIGTGGGFPGIPLAIFFPEVQFHLVDSIAKKLKVVQAVVDALELKNVTIQHTRVENIKKRAFDYAVSRAVAPLKDLIKWAKPIIHKKTNTVYPSGLICLKGGNLSQEIADTGTRPRMMEIHHLFKEPYFKEKYLLHIKC